MLESLSTTSPHGAQRLALGVKDNLRQVRLQLRVATRELAGRIAADGPQRSKARGAGTPWESVQGAAASVLSFLEAADRVACGLISPSPGDGQLACALVPLAQAVHCAGTTDGARLLTRGWYVAWKHLLQRQGMTDLCVSELAVHEGLQQLRAAAADHPAQGGAQRLAGLMVWHAAKAQPGILRSVEGAVPADRDLRPVLLRAAAALAVACESHASARHADPARGAIEWLTLADELVSGGLHRWHKALASERAAEALARECAFSVSHL